MTTEQAKRLTEDWNEMAGEKLALVAEITGTLYAHGSELACLRLAYFYRLSPSVRNVRAFYSANLGTWIFAIESSELGYLPSN